MSIRKKINLISLRPDVDKLDTDKLKELIDDFQKTNGDVLETGVDSKVPSISELVCKSQYYSDK